MTETHCETALKHIQRVVTIASSDNAPITLAEAMEQIAETLDRAVPQAAADAVKNGNEAVVLLSPACASFDQFRNFEVRGDAFRDLVKVQL